MTRRLPLALAMCAGLLAGAPEAKAQDAVAKQFVGMWRLTSLVQRLADGSTRPSPLSSGYLIYTDTGHMCAVLTNPGRPLWKVPNPYASTTNEAEAMATIAGADAYCSRVDINAAAGFVIHHVDNSVRPNLVGVMRKRWFKFDGPNRLSLSVDAAELTAPVVEGVVTWERVVD